jgi:nitrogen fixation protein NifU and related proteins
VSLDDLYRDVILEHYSHPRNKGSLEPADITSEGANPLCGDEIRISLSVRDGMLHDARFDGKGCSISQASASMMTELIKGRRLEEVGRLIGAVKAMMRGERPGEDLGDLEALQGVRRFPVRVKCATLGWVTLEQALADLARR